MINMTTKNKPQNKKLLAALKFLEEKGKNGLKLAREKIMGERVQAQAIHRALEYFMEKTWHDFYHPGLMYLTCKAVGGDPRKTIQVSAAFTLLRGAMDIHDDIIDQSVTKDSTLTVFGKFDKDIALLTADALFSEGYILLYEALSKFPPEKRKEIVKAIKDALLEMCTAEAFEIRWRKNYELSPEEYFEILKMKAATVEASSKIGAIIGEGKKSQIKALTEYGRILGILMIIRDEFIDIYEPKELENRIKNECLPLPILYALQDKKTRVKIVSFLERKEIHSTKLNSFIDLILKTQGVKNLLNKMQELIRKAMIRIKFIEEREIKETLEDLLLLSIKDLGTEVK